MTNAVATQINAASLPSQLFVSVQVETAWGRLPPGPYQGIAQGTTLPVLVVEGGWSSVSLDSLISSPAEQARYISRQARLADSGKALGVFQLTFYDLDLSASPPPPGSILPLFAHLGLADSAMHAKAALAVWDGIFRRPYRSQ